MLDIESKIHLYDAEKEGSLKKYYCKKVVTSDGSQAFVVINENGGIVLDPLDLFGEFIYIGINMFTDYWYACTLDLSVLNAPEISISDLLGLSDAENDMSKLIKFADKENLPELVREYFDLLESGKFERNEKLIDEYFGITEKDKKSGKKKKYKKGTLVLELKEK